MSQPSGVPVTKAPLIATLVRETRQRLGLTQKQFAAKLSVSYQSVNRWENGRTKPLPLTLKHIKDLLRQMGTGSLDLLNKYFSNENTARMVAPSLPGGTLQAPGGTSYLKEASLTTQIPPREPDTNMQVFDQQIEGWRWRLAKLQVSLSPLVQPNVLTVAFEEFNVALEELQMAQEELYQHNEELVVTRQIVEAERQRYQELFEEAPHGYLVTDAQGTIQEANRAAATLLNVERHFLTGKVLPTFVPQSERRAFRSLLLRLQEVERVQEWEMHLCPRYGEPFDAALTVTTMRNQAGQLIALRWLLSDITERKQAEALRQHAFHDSLTRLPNRALFMNRLEYAFKQVQRHKDYVFAVLFLDLDRFKVINDSLGHTFGDQLLIAAASRLKACLRTTDTAARLGGDEFTILVEGIKDTSDAIRVANRIQEELALPFDLDGQEAFTSASIGIALSSAGYDQPEDILRDADTAMYRAKALGKARYEIFNTDMYVTAVSRLQLETDLRRAIERQEFRVYYQPIVSLKIGRIIGFEALVRWQHPIRGLLPPEEFLPVVEETGLSVALDQWVLRQACNQMRFWQMAFPAKQNLTISVNFGSKLFAQPNLIEQVNTVLHETGLDAPSLKLEITESAIVENAQSVTDMLLQLKALGIELLIDDFGTGYSSLGRLHSFPINVLKIDRSFIAHTGETPVKQTGCTDIGNLEIVETIVTLAQKLGVDVTAEGVETKEQLARLRELNCNYGQGYFFSPPLDSSAAEALIVANLHW